jgi:dipeptidyl aminopeptidase/acylaminoacyl peptidase
MWYAIVAVFIILIIMFAFMQIAFSIVIPSKKSIVKTREIEKEKDSELIAFYDELMAKTTTFKSRYNYDIAMYYFLQKENTKKFVVIAHGHTYTHFGSIKYAKMMFEEGFNVIIYDQRYHGASGGNNTTLGYFEKYDLYDIITEIYNEFGTDIFLGTYGESMGAATILLEQEIDERVKFCISDCGYNDFKKFLFERLSKYHLPKLSFYFINFFVKLIAGFSLEDVSPIKAIKESKIPIMFIHGKQDKFIEYHHSVEMYEAYNSSKKLFIADNNATHAYSYFSDKEKYVENVKTFLKEYVYDKI